MKDKIELYIEKNFICNDISHDDSLLEKGILDSTGILELILFLEDEYHITISNEEIIPDNFDSINKIKSFVKKRFVE